MKRRTWLLALPALAQKGAATIIAPYTWGTGRDIVASLASPA